MSCISKMNNCAVFTDTEKRLQEYLLAHPEETIHDTAQSFASKTNTSAAAVIRFSKKLGYKGFTELKVDLAKDNATSSIPDAFCENIEEKESMESIIKKVKQSDLTTVEETYDLLRHDALNDAIHHMKKADSIYLLGIGASGMCCMDIAQKLTRVGKRVIFFSDFHMQLAAMSHITSKDCVLAISYSGNTKEINTALQYAKDKNCPAIGITQLTKSPMHKLCNTLLYVPRLENDLRLGAVSSRNASLILTDLLYLGIIRNDLTTYKDKLKQSRDLILQLK